MNSIATQQKLPKQPSYEIACQLHFPGTKFIEDLRGLFKYSLFNISETFFISIPAANKGWNTKLFSTSTRNRSAATVDLKAAANVPNIITNMLPAVDTRAKFIGGFTDEKIGFATTTHRAIRKPRH